MSDMFNHVPINNRGTEYKRDYESTNNYTAKTEECFRILNEIFDFFGAEYKSLDAGYKKHGYEAFGTKMDSISTIAKALNTPECKEAIKEGYRLYIKENKRYNNN